MALIAVLGVMAVVSLAGYFAVLHVERNRAAKAKEKAEYRGLANDMDSFIGQVKEMDVGKRMPAPEARETQIGSTEAEKIREALGAFMRNQMTIANAYHQEMDKAGISRLLDATRIAKDQDLKETVAMMKAIRAVAEDYKVKIFAGLESAPELVRAQKFDPATEAEVMRAVESGLATTRPTSKEIWDLELKSVGVMEDLIAFLDSKKGSWKLTEGGFVFNEGEDADRYNKYFEDLDKMLKRQEELQKAGLDRAKSAVDEMKTKTRD